MKTILLISPYWKEDHRWMVSTVKLAELWQRLGYKVVVLCMGRSHKSQVKSQKFSGITSVNVELISDTLEIHRVPDVFIPDPWNYGIALGFGGHAVRLVRELRPDVIVVNKVLFWSSFALLRLRVAGYPVLLVTDALVGMTWWPRSFIARVCALIYAWTLGWVILRAATKVVFFHPQPSALLKRLGISEKSRVIPTGIDPVGFSARVSKDTKEGPSAQKKKINVAYIGRMESVKGADDFVAAVLRAKQDCPDIHPMAVGWYKEHHPLVEKNRDSIEFTGLRSDIPAILAETDIFVLPSYSEGLSNALMEAMASGCACIASDVGGNRFLIENGISGFLFPAGDREALASHIRRLASDPTKRTSLGIGARRRIEAMFSWDRIGTVYRELFASWPSQS